jgi:hypothetical protein
MRRLLGLATILIVAGLVSAANARATVLLGDTNIESVDDGGTNTSEAFGYTASASGTATDVEVYLSSTSGVQVAVYADDSVCGEVQCKQPGTLLDQGSVATNQAGWVDVKLNGGVAITQSQRYWITIVANPGTSVEYRDVGDAGSNLDYSGNGLQRAYSIVANWYSNPASVYLNGTTAPPPARNLFQGATATTPDSGPDPDPVQLGMAFHTDRDGNVLGVRFYKAVANGGTHVGTLFSGDGIKLAQATFDGQNGSGWQDVQFSPPVAIKANMPYVVAYSTTAGHYADDQNYPWPKTAPPITGEAGTYCHGDQNCFPADRWNGANYYVDLDFQATGSPPPPQPPKNTAPPQISGTPQVGDTLDVRNGTWSGDAPMTFAYQWQDCASGSCSDISGATSQGYRIQDSDLNHTIQAVVTASNAAGKATANSQPTAAIRFASPGSGRFAIGPGGVLIDPSGHTFTPVGVNVNGPNWVWGDAQDTAASVNGMAPWHFNTVRVNIMSFCHSGVLCIHTNDDLDKIVNAYTSRHYVVVLDQHDYGSNGDITPDQQAQVKAYWQQLAPKYKDNPYVWFDVANEPSGGWLSTDTAQTSLARWYGIVTNIADTVHAAAPDSMLVIEGVYNGQDHNTWNCTHAWGSQYLSTDPNVGYTGALTYGKDLQARYGNQHVVFSAHVYGMWAGQKNYGCLGPYNDPYQYWREDLNTYLDGLQAENLPLLVGEYGAVENLADEQWYAGGAWDAAHVLMEQVAPSRELKPGVIHWACSPETGYPLANPDHWCLGYDPAQVTLTWQGTDLFTYAKLVNP